MKFYKIKGGGYLPFKIVWKGETMKTDSLSQSLLSCVLADIIQDFLEMTCKLAEKERTYLVRELAQESVSSDAIEIHAAFSIGGRIIVVGNAQASECWLYAPKARKILKMRWPKN